MDLEAEAVRLARLLVELMPDEPEVLSLLALLLFTSARTPARSDAGRNPLTLADQDRVDGTRPLPRDLGWLPELSTGRVAAGPYRASGSPGRGPLHRDEAGPRRTGTGSSSSTTCSGRSANPVVALNRAVAVTERDGPSTGWPR